MSAMNNVILSGYIWYSSGSAIFAFIFLLFGAIFIAIFESLNQSTGSGLISLLLMALGISWLFGGDD